MQAVELMLKLVLLHHQFHHQQLYLLSLQNKKPLFVSALAKKGRYSCCDDTVIVALASAHDQTCFSSTTARVTDTADSTIHYHFLYIVSTRFPMPSMLARCCVAHCQEHCQIEKDDYVGPFAWKQ